MIKTEIAKSYDIQELCRLLEELFSMEKEFEPDIGKQEKGIKKIMESSSTGFIAVIKDNEKIIGMVNILYVVSTFLGERAAILEDMIIDREYRGKGYGTTLIKYAVEEAEKRGAKRVTLLTDDTNESAMKFYEKNGFKKSEMQVMRKYF